MRLLHERDLAREEVAEVDELGIVGEELRGRGLEREPDAHPEAVRRARALDARFHDPGPGAGDHHPVDLGQLPRDRDRLLVQRIVAASCAPSRRSRPSAPSGTARTPRTRTASP